MTLAAEFDTLAKRGILSEPLPEEMTANLSPAIVLRPYQIAALQRFRYYIEKPDLTPIHLLFHMATGSGKTVLMAAAILELFRRGHRDFVFFVNSSQIVEKTRANFLDAAATKYLFADTIRIDGRPVAVRAVESFAASDPESINIHFTTIQGLHSRMVNPRENGVTAEDFAGRQTVLISDEAHHLNAETIKTPGQGELDIIANWEGTVRRILTADPGNIMLEFTATVNLSHPAIAAKYADKILFDYGLRQFREDGWSKDVMLRRVDGDARDRMLRALIISQHRRAMAAANGLDIKPVVLMKSRQVAESKANETAFHEAVAALDGDAVTALRVRAAADATVAAAFDFLLAGIDAAALARTLRMAFAPERCVNVNDNQGLEARQILLNTLEDRGNEIRIVFAVDKLNEGWDVLNLYDIVRLYDVRTDATSTAEKQLIGRGARYFPFAAPGLADAPRARRKFDSDASNPLRLLEQLHYHCAHDPDYIAHIREVLVRDGIMAADERTVVLRLKEGFRQSNLFQTGLVFANRLIRNERAGVTRLADYFTDLGFDYPALMTGRVSEVAAFATGGAMAPAPDRAAVKARALSLADMPPGLVRHALDANPFFRFDALRRHFPQLAGMRHFIESPDFLAGLTVTVRGLPEHLDSLGPDEQLGVLRFALGRVEALIAAKSIDRVGSRSIRPQAIRDVFGPEKTIKVDGERAKGWKDSALLRDLRLDEQDWFVFEDTHGTSEEQKFIAWIHDRADALRAVYEQFYLVRNERVLPLFAFADGARFEPDYLLFLRRRDENWQGGWQVFVDPKNTMLAAAEPWKAEFLAAIGGTAEMDGYPNLKILGLPFFNAGDATMRQTFEVAFQAALLPG